MMPCLGTSCKQGRASCASPILCSGAGPELDAAIRLHRAMNAPLRDIGVEAALPAEFTDKPIHSPDDAMTWTDWLGAFLATAAMAAFFYAVIANLP